MSNDSKEEMKRLTILLPESAFEQLRLMAFQQHKGMSVLAREALEILVGTMDVQHGGKREKPIVARAEYSADSTAESPHVDSPGLPVTPPIERTADKPATPKYAAPTFDHTVKPFSKGQQIAGSPGEGLRKASGHRHNGSSADE